MSNSCLDSSAGELVDILGRLSHYKAHHRAALPVDLIALKERMDRSYPGAAAMRAADYGLLREVAIVLARAEGAVSMGELSRALDVPLSSTTRIADWLVTNGYVERQPDPADRRIVRVALTEAGREIARAMHTFVQEQVAGWLKHFTPEERVTLTLLLRKLLYALEAER